MENKVLAAYTATQSLAEIGTGCAGSHKDVCRRENTTSFLPSDRAIKILKNGSMWKGEGHLEGWVGERQMFKAHCKPTCEEQTAV